MPKKAVSFSDDLLDVHPLECSPDDLPPAVKPNYDGLILEIERLEKDLQLNNLVIPVFRLNAKRYCRFQYGDGVKRTKRGYLRCLHLFLFALNVPKILLEIRKTSFSLDIYFALIDSALSTISRLIFYKDLDYSGDYSTLIYLLMNTELPLGEFDDYVKTAEFISLVDFFNIAAREYQKDARFSFITDKDHLLQFILNIGVDEGVSLQQISHKTEDSVVRKMLLMAGCHNPQELFDIHADVQMIAHSSHTRFRLARCVRAFHAIYDCLTTVPGRDCFIGAYSDFLEILRYLKNEDPCYAFDKELSAHARQRFPAPVSWLDMGPFMKVEGHVINYLSSLDAFVDRFESLLTNTDRLLMIYYANFFVEQCPIQKLQQRSQVTLPPVNGQLVSIRDGHFRFE